MFKTINIGFRRYNTHLENEIINSFLSIILGINLAIINAWIYLVVSQKAIAKDWKQFYKIMYLSMTGRIVFLLLALWISIAFIKVDVLEFVLSLIISYFFAEILSVLKLNKIYRNGKRNLIVNKAAK